MPAYQRIGLHVSAAGGVQNAPDNAKEMKGECFQFFSRSPRGGAAPKITDEIAQTFKEKCKTYGFEAYIHTPYYINFASKKKGIRAASSRIVREELERGSLLGVKYVVTHLGSAHEYAGATEEKTPREALDVAVQELKEIFKGGKEFSSKLLLEIAAGSGSVVGDSFKELAYILEKLNQSDVHVCLDTCHLFAAGYDVRTAEAWDETMKQFRKTVGMSELKLVHTNDSKTDFNGRRDRHEHIGDGKIGGKGFQAMLAHKDLQKVNFVLETPKDERLAADVAYLKKYRKAK